MRNNVFCYHLARRTLFSLLFLAACVLGSLCLPTSHASTVIDFESLAAPGSGTGGLVVRNQFASSGVIFDPVIALDYSLGIPIPGFAHSGTRAIELCYAAEFCSAPLNISFTTPQRRVKLWVGYSFRLDSPQSVVLRAYNSGGTQVAYDVRVLGPSTTVIPIATPLEVTLPTATVSRVTIGFL